PQSMHFSTLSWKSIPHPIPRTHLARFRKWGTSARASAHRVVTHPPSITLGFGPPAVTQVYYERTRDARITTALMFRTGQPWKKEWVTASGSDPSVINLALCAPFSDRVCVRAPP